MKKLHLVLAPVMVLGLASPAWAQNSPTANAPLASPPPAANSPAPDAAPNQAELALTPEESKGLHLAAANQLGVLEFCQSNGSVGSDVVDLQRKMIGQLPPPADSGEAEAEALGKQGIVAVNKQQVKLEDAAKTHKTTVAVLCGKMADLLKKSAADAEK